MMRRDFERAPTSWVAGPRKLRGEVPGTQAGYPRGSAGLLGGRVPARGTHAKAWVTWVAPLRV